MLSEIQFKIAIKRVKAAGHEDKIEILLQDYRDTPGQSHVSDGESGETSFGGGKFVAKYVFPDGELPHISLALESMQRGGLEAIDVESVRWDYARTLGIWAERFEANAQRARKLVDDDHFRIWRAYLAGCSYAFEHDDVSIYKVIYCKAGCSAKTLPWSRRFYKNAL